MPYDKTVFAPLLEIVYTKPQVEELVSQLELVLTSLFNNKESAIDVLGKFLSHDYKDKVMLCADKSGTNISDPSSLGDFLRLLIDNLKATKVVRIDLAFVPKDQQVAGISSWFLGNIKEKVFLDISIDRNLVGGVSLSYEGNFYEYSLKKKLEEKYKLGDFRALLKGN
ncbi:MAG: F0F1 ATP synthase subunit delta [Patescibacteria group bacterium]